MSHLNSETIEEIKAVCKDDEQLNQILIELIDLEKDTSGQWRSDYLDILQKYSVNTEKQ